MHKTIWILLILLCFSCESFFHDDDNQYLVLDKQEEKVDLLVGIYSQLTEIYNNSYLYLFIRSDDINVYQNYSFYYTGQTGVIGCTGGSGSIRFDEITNQMYLNLYQSILNANNLIVRLEEETDAAIIGEAYFLRAYCYFMLARFFGKVPLVRDIDVNYMLEKPSYREVYELIEEDLLKALDLLPETYSAARIPGETPNKGTVKALLAEVYLSMAGFPVKDNSKYAESARLAGEVIEQADYYGYALLDDMADLWKIEHRHNSETIFGLYFSGKNQECNNYFGGNYVDIYSDYQFMIGGLYNPKFKFFDEFPNNYRKQISVVTGQYEGEYYDTLGGYENSTYFRTYDPLYNACYYIDGAKLMKWMDIEALTREDLGWGNQRSVTLCLLRYAQTLLTYAEAKSRAGNLDESCYDAVNKIRRRANKLDINTPSEFDLSPGLTPEQFLDSVVMERAWELFGEPEGRWFDIIRLDMRSEIPSLRYSIDIPIAVPNDLLNEDWYFFLIPQEDRWLNPNFAGEDD